MNNNLTKIFDSNWFYLSVLGFAIALPLSQGLVSVMAGIMLLTALIEDSWQNKKKRISRHKYLFFLPAIFLIYLLSSVLSFNNGEPFYDLQKTLFYLVIPVAFIFGKSFSSFQQRFLFFVFASAILISTLVGVINWALTPDSPGFSVHDIGLISHIRFSFQLILAFWFMILMIKNNQRKVKFWQNILMLTFACYLLGFLLFQQSLTGLIAFGSSLVFYIRYLIFKIKSKKRFLLIGLLSLSIILPVVYIVHVIHNFYDFEEVDKTTIDKKTSRGNPYSNDFTNPMVENGNYVYLFVNEDEMREEWNKISGIQYDSLSITGYPISASLVRYLTSKGLKKDADGIHALTENDI